MPRGDQGRFLALLEELDSRLGSRQLSVSVGYPYPTNNTKHYPALFAAAVPYVDRLHLMAYGLSGPWPGWSHLAQLAAQQPGADIPWYQRAAPLRRGDGAGLRGGGRA